MFFPCFVEVKTEKRGKKKVGGGSFPLGPSFLLSSNLGRGSRRRKMTLMRR